MKKIYFHIDNGSMPLLFDDSKFSCAKSYLDTSVLINNGVEEIHTTDMTHFTFDLIDKGYEIYLCYKKKRINIEPGMSITPGTGKELRRPHLLYRVLMGGAFNEMLGINVNTGEEL